MFRLSATAALALFASPALAERAEVTCASSSPYISDTTICETYGSFSFPSDGPEVPFYLTLTAPASHCSDVSYLIFRSGNPNAIGFTTRQAPGESQNIEIGGGFGPGATTLEIGAIGYVRGCNTGAIGSGALGIGAAPVP